MIGTHNSGTGEPSSNWYYKLLIPFAKCQKYNINNQLIHGSKLFDLRIREIPNNFNDYVLCHGIWKSSTTLNRVLDTINNYGIRYNTIYKVLITYEGSLNNIDIEIFKTHIKSKLNRYTNIHLVQIAIKKPKWNVIYSDNITNIRQGFKCLDFSSWHTFIPIPWLWSKFYTKNTESDNIYTLIDFL